MYTTALIDNNGAIDWFCYPHHDSPSVFGAMLDHQKEGSFQIVPCVDGVNQKQFYWPETNILVTRFLAECGFAEVVDFMPVGLSADERGYHWQVRQVRGIRCNIAFRLRCQPAFNYVRDPHRVKLGEHGAIFHSSSLNLALVSPLPLETDEKAVWTELTVQQGDVLTFVLRTMADGETGCGLPVEREEAKQLFEATIHYWRDWLSACVYKGRWREMVERSALVLKLLTFEPTGAIVAAPTCSLPEKIDSRSGNPASEKAVLPSQ